MLHAIYNWTPAHIARRQHYLNIFEVLRQVTTIVESWETEEELIMHELINNNGASVGNSTPLLKSSKPPESDQTSTGLLIGPRGGGINNRLEIERPDTMGEHPITDTEEECVEPEFALVPASPNSITHCLEPGHFVNLASDNTDLMRLDPAATLAGLNYATKTLESLGSLEPGLINTLEERYVREGTLKQMLTTSRQPLCAESVFVCAEKLPEDQAVVALGLVAVSIDV
ncbi:unnamed protein product [Protopolystoma xenopodis]|uniref:Uncharacterized protein n=1 Tax=Protopolystoma xenopodis TaxID=117903 RepID=A0A3S4ZN61_9PLAT|nr:unnamed protein product [Protopolystoma xenopodis]